MSQNFNSFFSGTSNFTIISSLHVFYNINKLIGIKKLKLVAPTIQISNRGGSRTSSNLQHQKKLKTRWPCWMINGKGWTKKSNNKRNPLLKFPAYERPIRENIEGKRSQRFAPSDGAILRIVEHREVNSGHNKLRTCCRSCPSAYCSLKFTLLYSTP